VWPDIYNDLFSLKRCGITGHCFSVFWCGYIDFWLAIVYIYFLRIFANSRDYLTWPTIRRTRWTGPRRRETPASRKRCSPWRNGALLQCGVGMWNVIFVPFAAFKLWVRKYILYFKLLSLIIMLNMPLHMSQVKVSPSQKRSAIQALQNP